MNVLWPCRRLSGKAPNAGSAKVVQALLLLQSCYNVFPVCTSIIKLHISNPRWHLTMVSRHSVPKFPSTSSGTGNFFLFFSATAK